MQAPRGFENVDPPRSSVTFPRVPEQTMYTSDATHVGTINSARHASGVSPRGRESPTPAQESPRRRGSQLADVVRQETRKRSPDSSGLQRKGSEANGAGSRRASSPRRHSTSPERKSSEKPGAAFLDHLRMDHPGTCAAVHDDGIIFTTVHLQISYLIAAGIACFWQSNFV